MPKTTTKSIAWFVKSCLADKGYPEHPLGSNNTKYGVEFGWNKVAWCEIYGWCKYLAAGVVLPIKSASCVAIYDYCVKNGLHYNSTSCVPGDAVIRTWQRLSRNSPGFDPSETHFQEVLKVKKKLLTRKKMLGLWGGNQGAGYVGPDIEWVPAGDATILGGLAFHRLFNAPQKPAPAHDKAADTKAGLTKPKSHPNVGKPATAQADALSKRLKGKTAKTAKSRAALIHLRNRLNNVIRRGKAKS